MTAIARVVTYLLICLDKKGFSQEWPIEAHLDR